MGCLTCEGESLVELWRSGYSSAALELCRRCMSVQRRDEPRIEISGALVLRTRDRFAALEGEALLEAVAGIAADDQLFVLLRVDEIFGSARRVLTERARLTRPAEYADDFAAELAAGQEELGELRARADDPEALRARAAAVFGRVRERASLRTLELERYERFDPAVARSGQPRSGHTRAVVARGLELSIGDARGTRLLAEATERSPFVGDLPRPRFLVPLDLLV